MTIDDLRALAEKAKAWKPSLICYCKPDEAIDYCAERDCGEANCDTCIGAQRACEDIAAKVDVAIRYIDGLIARPLEHMAMAHDSARIASYFGPESNPVAEFAAAVMEFCK